MMDLDPSACMDHHVIRMQALRRSTLARRHLRNLAFERDLREVAKRNEDTWQHEASQVPVNVWAGVQESVALSAHIQDEPAQAPACSVIARGGG